LAALLSVIFPNVNEMEKNNSSLLPSDALSLQAQQLAEQEFPNDAGTPALIVWHNPQGLATDDLNRIKQVGEGLVRDPLEKQSSTLPFDKMPVQALQGIASDDGTTLITPVFFTEGVETEILKTSLETLRTRTAAELGFDPFASDLEKAGLHARISGPAGIQVDATALFKSADVSLLLTTIGLVLVMLILLYRSPLLALIPLVGVGFAYGVISPILGQLAKMGWIEIDSQSVSIMTVLLFGAGTDYCLFFVAKYRSLLLEEKDKYRALRLALSGSSGAVVMSGLTVIISLLALLVARYGSYQRFAIPFALAIMVMVVASLTLVPALLAIFGRASFFPIVPRTPEMEEERAKKSGKTVKQHKKVGVLSLKLGALVVKRPWTVLIVTVLLLGGLAAFSPQIKYTYNLLESFPATTQSREGFALISDHVSPGSLAPVQVIVDMEGQTLPVREELEKLSFVDEVSQPVSGNLHANYASFDVTLKDDPYANEAIDSLPELRSAVEDALRSAGIEQPESKVWIAGQTATLLDTKTLSERDTKLIIPIVIVVISLLLLVYLRSIVAMAYLILTVLLSYFSALGLGWLLLHGVMDFNAIQGFIPLYAFVFLVALGEDYNIFMISSIWRKSRDRKLTEAVEQGVSETSSVITSAGLILAGTFAVLATLPIQVLVQFGVITAVGVLLDTFLVRPFLVPAITVLLGKWAFWPSSAK
ncbi:MAG: MMPL family transporter, partial [Tumebacillaceae bacterium]